MSEARILLGSDVCPTERNEPVFRSGDANALFGNLLPDLQDADLTLVNLECPLVERPTSTLKSGPVLRAHPDCARALVAAGVDVVTLANNHALDHGRTGLEHTWLAVRAHGLTALGAGPNRLDAMRPFRGNLNGRSVAVLAMAEHEFAAQDPASWCVNPLNVLACTRQLPALREQADYVIVIVHGGVEHYPYPSPKMRDIGHLLIEQGADLVTFQHTHCVGCVEYYQNGAIVYGQGNTLFQTPETANSWNEGLLLDVRLSSEGATLKLIPCFQQDRGIGVRRMDDQRAAEALGELDRRSAELQTPGVLEDHWNEFCRSRADTYLGLLRGYGRVRGKINRMTGYARRAAPSANLACLCNLVRCEGHQEILVTALEQICRTRQVGVDA